MFIFGRLVGWHVLRRETCSGFGTGRGGFRVRGGLGGWGRGVGCGVEEKLAFLVVRTESSGARIVWVGVQEKEKKYREKEEKKT